MNPPTYVMDTQMVVWFAKGLVRRLGLNAFVALIHPRARVVVPSYVLEEVGQNFARHQTSSKNEIKIPPTALLRLLHQCSNVRVLPRGAAVLAKEFKLRKEARRNSIPAQDIPIAAALLVVRDYYTGPVVLITVDRELTKWATAVGIPILADQVPFEFLPS